MAGTDPDFDALASELRFDGAELRTSLEVLASKLLAALPGRTRVRHDGGGLLRRGARHVREIEVRMGQALYRLSAGADRVECAREHEVGGISIKRESLDPRTWVAALTADLRAESEHSAQARDALARLLA